MQNNFTVDQATDLAKYFLGPQWYAWTMGGLCILGTREAGIVATAPSWREAFRRVNVHLPLRPQFVVSGLRVMLRDKAACTAASKTMAQRICNALNEYQPSRRGE